jgi:vitamin K-dependent gamma-carboxylase
VSRATLTERLTRPVDAAGLAVFRAVLGAILCVAAIRALARGTPGDFFEKPTFFFKYFGFEWVPVLPAPGMTVLAALLIPLSLAIAVGWWTRLASAAFVVVFSWLQLADVSNYLNHYYLVVLIGLLFVVLPVSAAWSVDARRRGERTTPWFVYGLLRAQIGCVYLWAAFAKLEPDWLLHGEPLGIWLAARTDTPLVGPWLASPGVALTLSWAGFLNDLLAVPLLAWRRTRAFGYAMIVLFHLGTSVLFDIGVFPWLMMAGATLFFEPEWPRRFWTAAPTANGNPVRRPRLALSLAAVWIGLQVLLPLRSAIVPGSVVWHEQGMRWSWRVMLREKNGAVRFFVERPGRTRPEEVPASRYLTSLQEREMAIQPDLILQLAKRIEADVVARHGLSPDDVVVRADAWVSLNGRRAARFLDPTVDLTAEPDRVFSAFPFVLGAPAGPPSPHVLARS